MTVNTHGYFRTPYSTTGWGFRNASGATAFDTHAPGKNNRVFGGGGYALGHPGGLSAKDAQYFLNQSGAKYELSQALRPLQSQVAKLQAGGMGEYNTNVNYLRQGLGQAQSQVNAGLAAHGFLNSGGQGLAMRGLGDQYAQQEHALSRQFGPLAVADLNKQISDARASHVDQVMSFLLNAAHRKHGLSVSRTLGGS